MREKVISTSLSLPFSYEASEMGLQSHASEPEMKEHQCHSSGCVIRSCSKAFCQFVPRAFNAYCLPGAAVSSKTSFSLCSHPIIPMEKYLISSPLFPEACTALSSPWCRPSDFLFFCCSFISLRFLSLPALITEAVSRPFCSTYVDTSLGGETGT